MENKLLVLGLISLLTSTYLLQNGLVTEDEYKSKEIIQKFSDFKAKFGKKYASSEDDYRLAIYTANFLKVEAHNADSTQTYTLGENQFMDVPQEEFVDVYLMKVSELPAKQSVQRTFDTNSLAGSADWRGKAVTDVKNQGSCGSCWTFSTTGALEGHSAVFGGGLKNFSEQQILDCVREDFGCYGCGGGWPYQALRWISQNGLVETSQYQYTARQGNCKATGGPYKPSGSQAVAADESQLRAAVERQPISVCVDASNWSLYRNGVFNHCSTTINHAVTLVGYTADGWIIKNSWATSWGEQGFIRLAPGNTCGVLDYAVYPF